MGVESKKLIGIYLPRDMIRRLRFSVADSGLSKSEIVEDAIAEYIQNHPKKFPISAESAVPVDD